MARFAEYLKELGVMDQLDQLDIDESLKWHSGIWSDWNGAPTIRSAKREQGAIERFDDQRRIWSDICTTFDAEELREALQIITVMIELNEVDCCDMFFQPNPENIERAKELEKRIPTEWSGVSKLCQCSLLSDVVLLLRHLLGESPPSNQKDIYNLKLLVSTLIPEDVQIPIKKSDGGGSRIGDNLQGD